MHTLLTAVFALKRKIKFLVRYILVKKKLKCNDLSSVKNKLRQQVS